MLDTTSTKEDVQRMLAENPLAMEQLRRITVERLLREAQGAIAKLNGNKDEPVPDEAVPKELVGP